jgi:hypothetical protein
MFWIVIISSIFIIVFHCLTYTTTTITREMKSIWRCQDQETARKMNTSQVANVIIQWSDARIQRYIERVSTMYKISMGELQKMLETIDDSDATQPSSREEDVRATPPNGVLPPNVKKLKKKELQDLCQSRGLPTTGNKTLLVERLLGSTSAPVATSEKKCESKRKNRRIVSDEEVPDTIRLKRSTHGNYVFKGLVVDPLTQVVIGREEEDGSVAELDENDIEKCNKYRIDFETPTNLDQEEEGDNAEDENDDETVIVEEETEEEVDDDLADEEIEYVYEA